MRELVAEARLVAGPGAGAWRLLNLRLARGRPEDERLRAALGRVAPLGGELRRVLDGLARRGPTA